jgi:two-component system sensor histidine kinase KdpD
MLTPERNIDLDCERGLYLLGDPDQLMQVVENLLGNAIKYAPADTPVHVRAVRAGERIRLRVQDSGPGIPPAALELIFEKFYRVPAPEAPSQPLEGSVPRWTQGGGRHAGLGLGLYISRRIIEAHGGTIWAENVPQGGAAFHIEMPACSAAPS